MRDTGGWVIMDETLQGKRKSPRFYLVAATGPAQALMLAHDCLGRDLKLSVRGPAASSHLKRRQMQLGDVLEIAGQRLATPRV